MSQRAPYDFITEKLEQSFAPDSQLLWEKMQEQLDISMPVEEDHRHRYLFFQLLASIILFCSISLIYINHVHYSNHNFKLNSPIHNSSIPLSSTTETTRKQRNINSALTIDGENKNDKNSTTSFEQKKLVSNHLNKKSVRKHVINSFIQRNLSVANSNKKTSGKMVSKASTRYVAASRNNIPSKNLSNKRNKAGYKEDGTIPADLEASRYIGSTFKPNSDAVNSQVMIIDSSSSSSNTSKDIHLVSMLSDSIQVELENVTDRRIRQLDVKLLSSFDYKGLENAERKSIVTTKVSLNTPSHKRGLVAGISLNYHLPLSHQEMSTIDINGKQNALIDYLPSIYVQYHFSEKWYLFSELGWINPQYTPNLTLFDHTKKVNNSQKQQDEVNLNKLYYLNIPLTINYQVAPHLFLGGGIEYSYLKRSILTSDQLIWEQLGSSWMMTKETKSVSVNANPHAVAKKNNSNSSSKTPVDSVAESFRSHDWRLMMNVNYQYHRFELGMNFARGLTPYIQVTSGSGTGVIKDRNEAIQLYLHYNLFDLRRKY